jgi:hypothetical protein
MTYTIDMAAILVGWVEPFAKPIALPRDRKMGIAVLNPSYALALVT